MPMQATIILDSGGFLIQESAGQTYLDVGYFETSGPSDIEVSEDGPQVHPPPPDVKLGKGNRIIDVEHLAADGRVKTGVNQSPSFGRDILLKRDLYGVVVPKFNVGGYDCILRFHSGTFESSDVRSRLFKEHRVSDDIPTGNSGTTREVANDILVHYHLSDGETLRLRRQDGTNVWSSASVAAGTTGVEVKILADASTDSGYYKTALRLRGPHYHLPNPDPPPMDSE
jgi:hypothetical protein